MFIKQLDWLLQKIQTMLADLYMLGKLLGTWHTVSALPILQDEKFV